MQLKTCAVGAADKMALSEARRDLHVYFEKECRQGEEVKNALEALSIDKLDSFSTAAKVGFAGAFHP